MNQVNDPDLHESLCNSVDRTSDRFAAIYVFESRRRVVDVQKHTAREFGFVHLI